MSCYNTQPPVRIIISTFPSIASFPLQESAIEYLPVWKNLCFVQSKLLKESALSFIGDYQSDSDDEDPERGVMLSSSVARSNELSITLVDRIVCYIGNRACERVFGKKEFVWS